MLRSSLSEALKAAVRAKDKRAIATIRLILAALKDRDIAAREKGNMEGISEAEITTMLNTMIRQRRESIRLYEQGGRLELAEAEREEIEVIEHFLPEPMSREEIAAAVDQTLQDLDAHGLKDVGRVMASLRQRHAGRMDLTEASKLVKARLA